MALRMPAKRRRPPSVTAFRSSNVSVEDRSSQAGSSPTLRAQVDRFSRQSSVKRLASCNERERATLVTSSSQLGQQQLGLHPGNDGRLDAGSSPECDPDINEREEDDSMNEVIMAVDLRDRGTVGCAYYVAREEKLYMMEDVRFGGIEIVETCEARSTTVLEAGADAQEVKLYARPTVILLSTRVDESIDAYLDPARGSRDSVIEDAEGLATPYLVEVRPSAEFGYEAGKTKLANIHFNRDVASSVAFVTPGDAESYLEYTDSNDPGYTGRQGKLLRLSGLIDLESRLTVGCAGAVLTYLQRRKAVIYLPGDTDGNLAFQVSSIETFSLSGSMFIDAETMDALQVMHSQMHPQSHNQGPSATGSKEGLSVYGLFHHLARTPQGRYLLRQYFLRPSLDVEIINDRLDTAATFLRPDNNGMMDSITKSLGQIKNMRTVVIHLRKGISNGMGKGFSGIKSSVWSSLRSFAFHALQIVDAISEMMGAESLSLRGKHRTVVKPGVDEELDNMKRTYDGSEDLLSKSSQSIAETVPQQYSLDLNVIFFPQIGFLISMKRDPRTGGVNYEGPGTDNGGWDRIFSTGDRVYYKDFRMRELDETLGDMYAMICDKEIEIIYSLGQEVLQYEGMLTKASDVCGELDSLLALARGAAMYRLTRPRITEDNIIHIKGGRHPLQELTVPSYVANDSFLGGEGPGSHVAINTERSHAASSVMSYGVDDQPSMLMMTGPNYSGKSVYLKQVALIVYMAHVGCFVPAEAAIIGLTDKILTRLATKETITRAQSAFMIDLQQVTKALSLATHRSLVIIDEFGKGTDSNDGAGLACGVFEHLLSLGAKSPKVLGATHFHEIFENGFLQPRPYLAFGHMEVRIDMEAEAIEDQVTYLYK
ncbi:MAG: hypothetical protein Q9225_004683 [Loekoesia sp. 1 TL-2023]